MQRGGRPREQGATLALNDLRLTLRDRASFFWMLVLPIGMMAFFGMFGGGGGAARPA